MTQVTLSPIEERFERERLKREASRRNKEEDDRRRRGLLTPEEYSRLTAGELSIPPSQKPPPDRAPDPFEGDPFERPTPSEEAADDTNARPSNHYRQQVEEAQDEADDAQEQVQDETYANYLRWLRSLDRDEEADEEDEDEDEEEEEEEEEGPGHYGPGSVYDHPAFRPRGPAYRARRSAEIEDAERIARENRERQEAEAERQRQIALAEIDQAYNQAVLSRQRAEEEEVEADPVREDDETERTPAGKITVGVNPYEDDDEGLTGGETGDVFGADDLTEDQIAEIYYANQDEDPLALTYLEYEIVYGSLRPDFAGGPRTRVGGPTTGPGGRLPQAPADDEPEARVLESTVEEETDDDGEDVTRLSNPYYFWHSELGLVRIVDGLFEGNRLPVDPVVLPDDTTLAGRLARYRILTSLPDGVSYDPDIQQYVRIDDEGRRIIQANLDSYGQIDEEAWATIIQQGAAEIAQQRAEDNEEGVYYYWDEEEGLLALSPDDFEEDSFPLPPAALPDDDTPAGRRRRADLFLSLPENVYYDATIQQWIHIDEEGRHIIQANLSGWRPGRELAGFDQEGNPIFLEGPEQEEPVGPFYFDASLGHYIGVDEEGRPRIVDSEGRPIPIDQLDVFEAREGADLDDPAEGGLAPNPGYQLQEGEFLPYIYDPLLDLWVAFRQGAAVVLAEAPDYTWDPETDFFTLLNESTGEFEVFNADGELIGPDGEPIGEEEEEEEEELPRILLPTGEPHSQFDIDFDLPIVGAALLVAEAAAREMRESLEGELLLSVQLRTYQEDLRAGYIVGAFIPEAAQDPDYAFAVSEGLLAAEETRSAAPLGDQLNVALLEVPTTRADLFVSAVEVWFTLNLEETAEAFETEEGLSPDEGQLTELIDESLDGAQRATANFVLVFLRERVPVRTGRLRDSITIVEVVPRGFASEKRLEVAARVFYAPFVAGYRTAVDLAASQGQAYANQFDVNLIVESGTVEIDQDPQNRYVNAGPGVVISFGERPDFYWGDEETWIGRNVKALWDALWGDATASGEPDPADPEGPDPQPDD